MHKQRPGTASAAVLAAVMTACTCEDAPSSGSEPSATAPPESERTAAEAPEPEPNEAPPHIVLIVLDTVRADHLSLYDYDRDTSPRLEALAETSTVYTRAMATSPWTLPSHASMFTGKLPMEHGAHTIEVEERRNNVSPLAETAETLPEVLGELGYQTAAFAANTVYLRKRWGLDQGFDEYRVRRRYAKPHTRRVAKWLENGREDGPFFLFVNYIDAHRRYNTKPHPGLLEEPAPRDPQLLPRLLRAVMPGRRPPPEDLVRKVTAQYDTALANLDEGVGDLLDDLEERGLLEDSLVIVTSDHGEYLGEHRLVEHSKDVYQPAMWVPLVVHAPGQDSGETNDTVIMSDHLPHVIASAIGDERVQEALQPLVVRPGERPNIAENYYTRTKDLFNPKWGHRFDRVRRVVYDWPYKYIDSSDGEHELYHLARDPDESRNLVQAEADAARELRAALENLAAVDGDDDSDAAVADRSDMTQKEIEQMKALGYVE